jgi:hypothetical protein
VFSLIWPFAEWCDDDFPYSVTVAADCFSYTPRSDFLLLLDSCPFLFIEVCSDPSEHDRFWMLLQAGILVRVMNSFKNNREGEFKSFIAVAIYVNSKFTAERYLVGQPRPESTEVRHQCSIVDVLAQIYSILQIRYVQDKFDLTTSIGAFQFLFELHNLCSALPCDDQLSSAASKLDDLSQNIKDRKMPGFTSRKTKKRKANDAGLDNSNAPPEWGGNPPLTHQLSNLGI